MIGSLKSALAVPALYQLYQEAGGFFGARIKAIEALLPIRLGMRVIDIGCGPGHIVQHLPRGIDYVGFDIDAPSIAYARRRFGHLGRFCDTLFDAQAARACGPADVVMMNGVLHHLDDATAGETLATIAAALAPGGVLFTLDGVYRPGQNAFGKWLLDHDRGEYVRDSAGYRGLLDARFADVAMHLREDLSRLPYSFAIGIARDPRSGGVA